MTLAIDRSPLYVHLPFCRHLCPFCDLPKTLLRESLVPRFLRALNREIGRVLPEGPWRPHAIFFGGGTPTALPAAAFRDVLTGIEDHVDLSGASEVSLEVEPGSLSDAHLEAFLSFGGNRISLGAQSFSPAALHTLGRRHSPTDVRRDAARIRRAGIRNLNLDLLFAVPGESLETFEADLAAALELEPTHLSLYNLTFEPRTLFHRWRRVGRLHPHSEEQEATFYRRGLDVLRDLGWTHYEVSNLCLPRFACRYNRHVWTGGDYRGIGPSAARHQGGLRSRNFVSPLRYIRALEQGTPPIEVRETLDPETRVREALFLALRQPRGLVLEFVRRRTGMHPHQAAAWPVVERLAAEGWVDLAHGRIRPTDRGLLQADSLAAEILQAPTSIEDHTPGRVAGSSPRS